MNATSTLERQKVRVERSRVLLLSNQVFCGAIICTEFVMRDQSVQVSVVSSFAWVTKRQKTPDFLMKKNKIWWKICEKNMKNVYTDSLHSFDSRV